MDSLLLTVESATLIGQEGISGEVTPSDSGSPSSSSEASSCVSEASEVIAPGSPPQVEPSLEIESSSILHVSRRW